ncbi:MAG: magnesium transporter CorA family protein [Ruminiclostridium sp.]|nr:magnesium transporter CorA family protein [Ruminiclostridium sp.]
MINIYRSSGTGMTEINEFEAGSWISAVAPTEAEISQLENELSIDRGFIRSALDEEESSRIESDEGQTLIVLDYPIAEKNDDDTFSYSTLPMGLILTESNVVSVSLTQNSIIDDFSKGVVKNVNTCFKPQFVFCILLRISAKYLQYLKQIEKIFNFVQKQLNMSMKNELLIQLLGLQKSLIYFSTSLKSTETVLEKLLRGRVIKLYDEDQELLEDVLVEIKQAIEMSNIYTNILANTMDAYSNIISNNMNRVMKALTIITIVLEIPNIIFAFYGINTIDLPFPYTWVAIAIAFVLAGVASVVLLKSKFLK